MFVDSHCHLQMLDPVEPTDVIIQRAQDAGVRHLLTVAISLADSLRTLELAERFPAVSASVGAHPSDDGPEPTVADLVRLAQSPLADRKSTRLNSSHVAISYAVFCLKKKRK